MLELIFWCCGAYLLDILTAQVLFNDFVFVNHYFASDVEKVINQDILLEDLLDKRSLFDGLEPFVFTNEEALHVSLASVQERCSLVEGDAIGSDDAPVVKLDTVALFVVELVANHDNTFIYESDLAELVELVDQNLVLFVVDGLQIHQDTYHEISVLHIIPSIEIFVKEFVPVENAEVFLFHFFNHEEV